MAAVVEIIYFFRSDHIFVTTICTLYKKTVNSCTTNSTDIFRKKVTVYVMFILLNSPCITSIH